MEIVKVISKWTFYSAIVVAAIIYICCASDKNGNSTLFMEFNISSTVLPNASLEFSTFNPIVCAQQAKARQRSHLFCFSGNGICSLYDLKLPPRPNYWMMELILLSDNGTLDVDPILNAPTDLITCYTDIHDGCIYANQYYPEGETVVVDCDIFTCTDMTWIPIGDCPEGYVEVIGVGCIVIVKTLQVFDEAKPNCESMGARLVIPDDFEALRQYILCKDPGNKHLVGIHNNEWMDGRAVDANTWGTDQPNGVGTQNCGAMVISYDHRINDVSCPNAYYPICQMV